jgi:two-component system NtrC family response regulator
MPVHELRILIVEDEPLVGRLFERILSDDGYLVRVVSRGRDAVRHIADHDYSVAIVDMSLPDMEGADVIRLILLERPYVKILAITGMEVYTMRLIAREAGAANLIGKPMSPDALRTAVFHLIDPGESWLNAST